MPKIALISRVGAHRPYLDRGVTQKEVKQLQTPFGRSSPIHVFQHGAVEFAVLSRHGEEQYTVSAAFVEERANIWALKIMGVDRIVSFDAVASLHESVAPGELLLLEDVLDLRGEARSIFEGKGIGAIRLNPIFCPEGRQIAAEHLGDSPFTWYPNGIYSYRSGPRLDTRAEARAQAELGATATGQALVPEVFVAKELELCYTALTYVSHWSEAAGERPYKAGVEFEGLLSSEEAEKVKLVENDLPTFFMQWLVDLVEAPRECPCQETMARYRAEGIIAEDWKQWIK